MFEVWQSIPGFDGLEASNFGGVRRLRTGFVYKPSVDGDGYRRIILRAGRRNRVLKICSAVCRAFHGNQPSPKHEVGHRDGSRTNDVPENLYWCTSKQNALDRQTHGRTVRGTKMHTNKLTEANVIRIRQMLAEKMPSREIARRFGISQSLVQSIKFRRIWAWL